MMLNKKEILNRLIHMEKRKEIVIEYRTEKFARIQDDIDFVKEIVRYPEMINRDDLDAIIDFGSLKLYKEKFFTLFEKYIEKNMLINVEGIYFLNNYHDYIKLREKHKDVNTEYHNHFGWQERLEYGTIVVINVDTIFRRIDSTLYYQGYSRKEKINLFVWEVLFHELRHALTNNILIQEEELPLIEGEESRVLSYARNMIENKVKKEDFIII